MTQSQRAYWGLVRSRVNSDQYGSLLIPVIMSKLPEEIRVRGASYFEQIAYHGVGNKQTQATIESSERDKIS